VFIVSIKKFGPVLRFVVAASILYLIAQHVGWQAILQRLKVLQVTFLIGAIALVLAENLIRIWNWQQILNGLGIRAPLMYRKLAACYLSGGFLGTVIPSTAGTDALRAIFAAYMFRGNVAFYSGPIVTLNVLGLTAGCCLGLAGILLVSGRGYPVFFLGVYAAVMGAVVLGAIMIHFVLKYRRSLIVGLLRSFGSKWFWLRGIARKFISSLLVFTRPRVRSAPILAVAVFDQFLRAIFFLLIARALDVELPMGAWLVITPLMSLAALAPVSIAGYGGEQVALVYLSAPFGVPAAEAVTVSLTAVTLSLFANIVVGGAAFLLSSHRLRPSAHDQRADIMAAPPS
jgi:uncharacterized membrane protein YbhN (UPF0104 family)